MKLKGKKPVKADHVRKISKAQIKCFLLQLDNKLLKHLVLEPLETTNVKMKHLLPSEEYPCVYAGVYLREDGTGFTIWDICRLANVLIEPRATLDCLELAMSPLWAVAARTLGKGWQVMLKQMGMCRECTEIEKVYWSAIPKSLRIAAQYTATVFSQLILLR